MGGGGGGARGRGMGEEDGEEHAGDGRGGGRMRRSGGEREKIVGVGSRAGLMIPRIYVNKSTLRIHCP